MSRLLRTDSSDSDGTLLSGDGDIADHNRLDDEPDYSDSTSEDDLSNIDDVSVGEGKYKVRVVTERNVEKCNRVLKYALLALLFAGIVGAIGFLIHRYGSSSSNEDGDNPMTLRVLKAPRDDAEYKVFQMESGMTVLLISDNSTANLPAAVSINVATGSLADPDDVPGLAHFLEHMLFMGTDKYPDEDGFSHFLSSNGGYNNAYTASANTNFFFQVNQEALAKALDMFAQFFISARLSSNSVSREMHAVDSEFRKDIPQDAWRMYRLVALMADPTSEFYRFTIGSLQTLDRADIGARLRKFYNDHYTADKLTLGIWSTQSLPELEKLARKLFAGVPHKTSPPLVPKAPYTGSYLGQIAHYTRLGGDNTIDIIFPVDSLQAKYRSDPSGILTWLLGHEANGTVMARLRQLGWATALSAGSFDETAGFTLLSVTIALTDTGSAHINEIISMVFQYLRLIDLHGVQKAIWKETQTLKELSFRFQQPFSNHMNEISALTARLSLIESPIDLLSPPSRLLWDAVEVLKVLDKMSPDRCLVLIGEPGTQNKPLHDNLFQFNYSLTPIPVDLKLKWQVGPLDKFFAMPPVNRYLPNVATLAANKVQPFAAAPKLLLNSPGKKLWWYPNHEFPMLPQVNIEVSMYSGWSKAATDPLFFYAGASLWQELIRLALDTNIYNAKLAGFSYSFYVEPTHIQLVVHGYVDQAPLRLFLSTVSKAVFHPDFKNLELFNHARTNLATYLKLFDHGKQLYTQGKRFKDMTLLKFNAGVRPLDVLPLVKAMTAQDLADFVQNFLGSDLTNVCFMHGSLTESSAVSHFQYIMGYYTASKALDLKSLAYQQTLDLKQQSSVTFRSASFDPADINSLVLEVIMLGKSCEVTGSSIKSLGKSCSADSAHRAVMVQLLGLMIEDQCFNQLRTQEQLGYIVFCTLREYHGEFQLLALVVSPDYNVTYIQRRIQAFLVSFVDYLSQEINNSTRMAGHTEVLQRLLLQQDKSFGAVTSRLSKEISRFRFQFDIHQQILAALNKLTNPTDLLEFYNGALSTGPRLSIQVFSHQRPAPVTGVDILSTDSLEAWRNTQSYLALQRVDYGV